MKTDFDMHQADLYQQFATFGRTVARNAAQHDRARSFDRAAWDTLSKAGLWRIPVPIEEGGLGGSWADCAAAMEGVCLDGWGSRLSDHHAGPRGLVAGLAGRRYGAAEGEMAAANHGGSGRHYCDDGSQRWLRSGAHVRLCP